MQTDSFSAQDAGVTAGVVKVSGEGNPFDGRRHRSGPGGESRLTAKSVNEASARARDAWPAISFRGATKPVSNATVTCQGP
jgi:hypothetical protein